ncbi:MAG: acyloxyacyl hydrolase [Desulfomonile tiedjei]|nr:acyloxyacyl hydrolase [Desulfomonile tiedjei]
MSSVCRLVGLAVVSASLILSSTTVLSWDGWPGDTPCSMCSVQGAAPQLSSGYATDPLAVTAVPCATEVSPFRVKLAYGRTYGTCTSLDYATLELSKPLTSFPTLTRCGPAVGEVQMALMASYVFYYDGCLERLKNLDFHDGYELAWLPKGRFTFPGGPLGTSTFLESGFGMSYVSETYRNSGSRWNWSILGGMGVEKYLPGRGILSFGIQWRHLSNGNMWGKGDELHNSNSGTDMIQGLASFVHYF